MSEGEHLENSELERRLKAILVESALETPEAKGLWCDWCITKEKEYGTARGSQILVMLAKSKLLIAKERLVARAKEELLDARESAYQEGDDKLLAEIEENLNKL